MHAKVFGVALWLLYSTVYSRADSISNFIILDQDGKNTCIADLHCFLSMHIGNKYTLSFDLFLEKAIEKTLYKLVIEQKEEEDIMKKQLYLCVDKTKKTATLVADCGNNDVISAGTYHVNAPVELPTFKDIASMIITGPNGVRGFRGIVSTLSSHPPSHLH